MKLKYHKEIIRYVLQGSDFSKRAESVIIRANARQDIVPVYALDGRRHFDRKKKVKKPRDRHRHRHYFYRAKNRVLDERAKTMSRIHKNHYYYAKWSLGRALHSLQDLFAHSNFIDLNSAEKDMVLAALASREDIGIPEAFKLTYFRLLANSKRDEYPHSECNKDGPECPGFESAREGAKTCSRAFVLGIRDEVVTTQGPEKWEKFKA